tara:strand:+ start:10007 stop:10414 length:408 start_codon:yes stop_codon:yes gene_type:complete
MIKLFSLLLISTACISKLSITSFKEQLEYPGIPNGTTIANYTIEIENKKNEEIEVEGVWVKGRWLKFTQTRFSGNPIIIRTRVKHIYSDSLMEKVNPPTKNKNDQGAIKYRIKGKEKIRFIGIEKIKRERALARP